MIATTNHNLQDQYSFAVYKWYAILLPFLQRKDVQDLFTMKQIVVPGFHKILFFVAICATVFVRQTTTEPASGPCALIDTGSSSICVSLDDINLAFGEARLGFDLTKPVDFPPLKSHHHHHDIDHLGLVLVEATRIVAKKYNLDYEQLYELLPKLDVELTDIWKFCPVMFKPKTCKITTKYRTLTGHCNNINNPDWGAAVTPFNYILPPHRDDGLTEPREYGSHSESLPSPRLVSAKIHRDKVVHDHAITTMLIAWGQIIDHDITFTAETKDPLKRDKDLDCCSENLFGSKPPLRHHNCYPIRVPEDDHFYSHYSHHCMNFARSAAGVRSGCRLGPRTSFNTISSFLDASFLYGSDVELGRELRSGKGGCLKTLPLFTETHLKDLLPLKVNEPDDGCIRPNSDIFCFLAGDARVNEQLVLTTLHTIFMRQHNEIAHSLSEINTHWDDEKLYQETRRIMIAIVQHITFNEFLPMILGKAHLRDYGLSVDEGYWTGYDPDTNAGAFEEFITSAFRFGHSLLPHKIDRWTTSHHYIESTKLHELLRQPFDLFRPGHADTFIMGLVNQLAQVMDEGVTDQVTTLLFKERSQSFGMDLAAMNIQRGRDHGIPPYAAYRKVCGLSLIEDWDDLIGVMRNETVHKYRYLYRSPWDIDLWSGGVSEIPNRGSLIGPTFGCIIAKQFHAIRFGDRFWYEVPDLPSSFTLDQLNEIKNIRLSRILCDNGDAIKTIQVYAMVHPDHTINPRVPCYSKTLPRIDLEKWRDEQESSEDAARPQNIVQKAHASTDVKILKPPLYDGHFDKYKKSERNRTNKDKSSEDNGWGKSTETNYGTENKSYASSAEDPLSLGKYIPPFRKIPDTVLPPKLQENLEGFDHIVDHFHYSPNPHYDYEGPPLTPTFDSYPPPRRPFGRSRKPKLLDLFRGRDTLLLKIFRRRGRKKQLLPIHEHLPMPYPPPHSRRAYSQNRAYFMRPIPR